jgi:sugar lactone lactonase YvrE
MKLTKTSSAAAWGAVTVLALLSASTIVLAQPLAPLPAAEVRHAWTRTQWDFPTPAQSDAYNDERLYTKAPLYGVKVDRSGRVFASVARILDPRVPATLNLVVTKNGQSVLQPFPSWEANDASRPEGLRSVLGFTIDSRNRLWALDMGYTGGEPRATPDGQKVVVFDLDSGRELRRIALPDAVADPATSFLNDIALDERRQMAYISDSGSRAEGGAAGGIIVLDLKTGAARRVLDRSPLTGDDPERPLQVNGEPAIPGVALKVGINGIALSPDGQHLYWSITTGDAVYSVETRHLRDGKLRDKDIARHVNGPIRIGGGSDGIAVGRDGGVYVTNVTLNRVQRIDPQTRTVATIAEGPEWIWPDTMAFDAEGALWVSTNHLNLAFSGRMDFDQAGPNFRIMRIRLDAPALVQPGPTRTR